MKEYIICSYQLTPNITSCGILELLQEKDGRKYVVAGLRENNQKRQELRLYLDDAKISPDKGDSVAKWHYSQKLFHSQIQEVEIEDNDT